MLCSLHFNATEDVAIAHSSRLMPRVTSVCAIVPVASSVFGAEVDMQTLTVFPSVSVWWLPGSFSSFGLRADGMSCCG